MPKVRQVQTGTGESMTTPQFTIGEWRMQIPPNIIGELARELGFKAPPNWARTLKNGGAATQATGRGSRRASQRSKTTTSGQSSRLGA
jgi:hypothetical protein